MNKTLSALLIAAATTAVALPGCSTVRSKYYNAWEYFGYDKRERLVDYVSEASESQTEAKEEFVAALDRFKELTSFDGGELEATYNELNAAFLSAEAQAADVKERIGSIENASEALFDEWDGEIAQIEDPKLVRASEELRTDTRNSLDQVVASMNRAADSMDPILTKFRDRILFLKGQLNARAIASLKDVELDLTDEIDELIEDMEASIAEAERFIQENQS